MSLSITAPLVAAATATLKFSSDFQSAMVKVGNLTDIGASNIAHVREEVLKLAPTVGIGPKALADGLLVVASTGLDAEQSMKVLGEAAKASAVGLGETKDIGRAVTAAIKAYGDENLTAAVATNKLFVAVREGGAEAEGFASQLGRVVGIAAQMGVSFDEVLANIATFTRLGVDSATATTGLRATILAILHPTAQAREAFQTMGTSIDEVRKAIREKGLAAAMQDVLTLAHGDVDAIGKIVPEARALASVLGTSGVQGEAYAEVLKNIQDGAGDLDSAFGEVSKTIGFKWNQALAKAQEVAIKFGDAIGPAFTKALDAMGPLVDFAGRLADGFAKLPTPLQDVVLLLGLLAAAAGPVAFEVGAIIKVVGFASTAVAWLATTFGVSTLAADANATALLDNAVAARINEAATTEAAGALTFAAGEQLSFAFAAEKGAQLMLPLSGVIEATGAAAATAAPELATAGESVGLLGAAVDLAMGPVGLLIGAGAGLITITGTWGDFGRIAKSTATILKDSFNSALEAFVGDMKDLGGAIATHGKSLLTWLGDVTARSPHVAAFKLAVKELADQLERLALLSGQNQDVKDTLKKPTADMAKMKQDMLDAGKGGIDIGKTMDMGTVLGTGQDQSVKSLVQQLAEAKKSVAGLSAEQLANVQAGLKMGLSSDKVTAALKQMFPALEITDATVDLVKTALSSATAESDKFSKAMERVKQAQVPLTDVQKESAIALDALGLSAEEIAASMKKGGVSIEQVSGFLDGFHNVANDARKAIDGIDEGVKKLDEATFKEWAESAVAEIKSVGDEISGLDDLMQQKQESISEIFKLSGDMMSHFAGEKTPGQLLKGDLMDNLKSIPSLIVSSLTGGGGIKGALAGTASLLGSTLGKNIGLGISSATKGFGALAGPIGAALGSLAGPAVELLMKAFDHKRKDFQHMGTQLGVDLSDGLLDQLKKDSKKFGGEVQAVLLNLDKIIAEAGGVAAFGLDKAIAKARDLFVVLGQGKLTAQQVGTEFDKVFAQILPEAIDKTTGLAKKSFLELIHLAQDFGVASEAATKFLLEQSAKTTSGLNLIAAGTVGAFNRASDTVRDTADAISTVKDKIATLQAKIADLRNSKSGADTATDKKNLEAWTRQLKDAQTELANLTKKQADALALLNGDLTQGQASFDRLGRLASVAFASALGSGRTFLEALDDIGPTLDAANTAQATFGFTSSGTFDELIKFRQFATDNKELIGTLDGVNQMMVGLNNSGALTQGTFNDLTSIASETFDKIVAGGLSSDQALVLMQPTLQTIWQLQKDFGFAVDDSTQKLVDQGVEAGIVGKEHESASDKMVDALKDVVNILQLIAIKFGAIPTEAQTAASGVDDAFRGKHIEVPITFPMDFPDTNSFPDVGADGSPTFARTGGMVGQAGIQYFRKGGPVGPDTVPAYLSPGEMVLTRDQQRQFFEGQQRDGQTVVVQQHFHGAVLAQREYIEKHVAEPVLDAIARDHKEKLRRVIKRAQ